MITLQYGPWTPDLANVSFQMPDQQGPVQVPVADCLNVYYANGTYQSLPNPAAISGGALMGQCTGVMTFQDANGNPIPCAGVLNGLAYYWTGSAWAGLLNTGFSNITNWNFCEFQGQVYIQAVSSVVSELAVITSSGANLYQVAPGGTTSVNPIEGALYGTVLAVVGQFVMIGDLAAYSAGATIGTGNGTQTTFTSVLGNTVPLYPTSVSVTGGAGQAGNDNGLGVITGTGIASGTVNYDTGAISVTFSAPVPNLTTVVTRSSTAYRARLQWSPIGNANPGGGWPTPLTNAAIAAQSGINDLESEFGPIMFIAGYPLYGVVFQRNAITRASYIGGNVVFSWQTYVRNQGLLAKGAAVQVGANTYFLSDSGFFYTDGGNVYPIGTASDNSAGIDQWFFSNVNLAALAAITAGYDAKKRCVFFAIPTGSNTLPDTLLTYNIIAGRWTRAAVPTEFIWIDSDGSTDRLGLFSQIHVYELLTAAASTGYLESCDLSFSDGNTRFTPQVRPNVACTDVPTANVGTRNSLQSAITYSSAGTPDPFGAGFAPTLTAKGIYTRVRVSSGAASAMNGATAKMRPGGPL
jgi:hypothetical protein